MADPMTFERFCALLNVTPEERMKLARHLAMLRAEATLKLGILPCTAGVARLDGSKQG